MSVYNTADSNPPSSAPKRPPTALTPLWAHIINPKSRGPGPASSLPAASLPPIAPLDKNATSMRVLLHDTQAHLEKFSGHVQTLAEGVREAKQEVKTANALFEKDRQGFMGDITDLINRSQREVQKAVGTPAQDERVQAFFNDFNIHLGRLDQRLDALQTFNQTHAQALQAQMQAVQILLDKQGSILTAVLPLLPLIQALPLYIDAAKNTICESIKAKTSLLPTSAVAVNPKTPLGPASHDRGRKRKRPSRDALGSSGDKKDIFSSAKKQCVGTVVSSPISISSQAPSPPNNNTDKNAHTPSSSPEVSKSLDKKAHASALSPVTVPVGNAPAARALATPRQPLGDLLPSLLPQPTLITPRPHHVDIAALWPGMRTASVSSAKTPALRRMVARPPHDMYGSSAQSRTSSVGAFSADADSVHHGDSRRQLQAPDTPALTGDTAAKPAAPLETSSGQARTTATPQVPRADPKVLTGMSARPRTDNILPNSALFGQERRSPVGGRRRYIPLVDSEDEDEE